METLFQAALCALAVWLCSWVFQSVRRSLHLYRLACRIPGPRAQLLIGNLNLLLDGDFFFCVNKALVEFGPKPVRMWLGPTLLVFIRDPEDIRVVVTGRQLNDKPKLGYSFLKDIMGDGLLSANGQRWKAHRLMAQPTFHTQMMEHYMHVFNVEGARLAENLVRVAADLDGRVELYDFIQNMTLRTVVKTTMSSGVVDRLTKGTLNEFFRSIEECMHIIAERIRQPWLMVSQVFYMTPLYRRQARAKALFKHIANTMIEERAAEKQEISVNVSEDLCRKKRQSFLDHVLEARLEGKSALSEEDLRAEIATIVAAGTETSATLLSFALKTLSELPDVQDRVHDELDEIFGDSDRAVTAADLKRLVYLERVVKETMRLFPPVPLIGRKVKEDTDVNGTTVPAGSTIVLSVFHAHRDARHFPEPGRFDPDRFLPERVAGRHPYAYLPFSAGARNCLGQRYALVQAKVVLSTVLRAARFLPADGPAVTAPACLDFPLTSDIPLRLKGGYHVRVQRRPGKCLVRK